MSIFIWPLPLLVLRIIPIIILNITVIQRCMILNKFASLFSSFPLFPSSCLQGTCITFWLKKTQTTPKQRIQKAKRKSLGTLNPMLSYLKTHPMTPLIWRQKLRPQKRRKWSLSVSRLLSEKSAAKTDIITFEIVTLSLFPLLHLRITLYPREIVRHLYNGELYPKVVS